MRKHLAIGLGIALLGLPALALAADFSGSWVRNNSKSDPPQNFMYWLTRSTDTGGAGGRGGRGPGGGRGAAQVMKVEQDGKSLRVTEPTGAVRSYALDGKPFTRKTDTGIQQATITAKLAGETLTIATTQPYGGMPGNATLEVRETWSLSPDGKTLTIAASRAVAASTKTYKQVYDRQ